MSLTSEASLALPPSLLTAEAALLQATGIPIERRDTHVGGLRLHYLVCGEGEPLLLLHGRGLAAATFAPILSQLAQRRRVIALDLPGWGLSDKPPFTGRTARDALDAWMNGVLAFLDDQGLTQVDMLGHSMGGFTALGLALEHPERVRRLILVAPGGLGSRMQVDVRLYFASGPERLHRLLGRRLTTFVMRKAGEPESSDLIGVMRDFNHELLTQAAVIPSGAAAFSRWVNLTGVHLTLRDRLHELAMPVLMLWGDRDTVVSYSDALLAARSLRDGQLVAFTRCGHMPFYERPEDFAHVLLTWLDGIYVPSRV